MAGTNITNLLEIIQRKIDASTSSTATQDLLYLLSAVRQGDGSALELYDSSGAFPDLTDSAADTEMIAYRLDSDRLYFNVGVWKGKTLPPPPPPPIFQGVNFGYTSGGSIGLSNVNTIDKVSFSSDANATDVGDLTVTKKHNTGQSSQVSGYTSGGETTDVSPSYTNIIDKFPFASDGNATDVGDLFIGVRNSAGQSSAIDDYGYNSGGQSSPGPTIDTIQKFPFATDTNASDIANLSFVRWGTAGQSSSENGYTSGGRNPNPTYLTTIDKFPFAADANATDVGDLTVARQASAGQSSSENGYTSGGRESPSVFGNIIDKFAFASDGNASDVGDLFAGRSANAGQSSTENGYSSAGYSPGPTYHTTIDKFPFATDTNATDVGDLTVGRYTNAGQQY